MSGDLSRRFFLSSTLAGAGSLAFLNDLPAPAPLPRNRVALKADIEPLVKLIEDTPRAKLIDAVLAKIKKGTSYQELLGGVFLAGVRGIQPRPVGFKFHAVLVINSAHQAAMAAADRERWLPILWAVDNFKESQETNRRQGNWSMKPVEESKVPDSTKAKKCFVNAMDNWDTSGADVSVTALARCAGASEVAELFWYYGARDLRDIGHKAIFAANAWRTLQAIGWRHGEPVLRSLAYALLMHEGTNPAKRAAATDLPGRANLKRAANLEKSFLKANRRSTEASLDVLETMRSASADDAAKKIAALLEKGIHPASIWDGLFLTAGELMMRLPGIVGVHCITSANALHFGYETSAVTRTRLFLLLQSAAFLAFFRQIMRLGEPKADDKLDKLEKADIEDKPAETIDDIFAAVGKKSAASKTLALLQSSPGQIKPLMARARALVFAKGKNSHDYKYNSAALEDYLHVSPALRARYAAATTYWLRGSGDSDNTLIRRTRAALAKG